MTSKLNGFPWVNVWMLVFSIGGIWLIWRTLAGTNFMSPGGSLVYWFALPILVVIGIVGVWRFPLPVPEEEAEHPVPVTSEMGELYLHSLRMIRRQKWIMILIGIIALVAVLEGLVESHFFNRAELKQMIRQNSLFQNAGKPAHLLDYIGFDMSTDLAMQVEKAPIGFYPGVNVKMGGILPPVAVLLFILWLNGKLSSIGQDKRLKQTVSVIHWLMIPVGIATLAEPVTQYVSMTKIVNMLIQNHAGHSPPQSGILIAVQTWAWYLATTFLISPLIMAGFVGSIKRGANDEPVTGNTFAEDAVKYVRPFVGITLVFVIISLPLMIPGWSSLFRGTPITLPPWFTLFNSVTNFVMNLAYMLLMFVPFVVVAQDSGSLRAFGIGAKHWVRNAGNAVAFVALGITLVVPVTLIERALTHMVGSLSVWATPIGLLFRVIDVVIGVWLSVAVWELYRRAGSKPAQPENMAEVV